MTKAGNSPSGDKRSGSRRRPPTSDRVKSQPAPPRPRVGGVREIGALLPDVGGVAFRRFGFTHTALLGRWAEIVGPVYARWSVPESIRRQRGEKTGGVLTIRVEGPFSLQLQHATPEIIERINRLLGHGAVSRIRLVQGDVPQPPDSGRQDAPVRPVPVGGLDGVRDAGLRGALEELARMLAAGDRPPKVS